MRVDFELAKSIRISIEKLSVGMFVTAIEESDNITLANAGRVHCPTSIKKLVDNGVKFAWVDKKLSCEKCEIQSQPIQLVDPIERQSLQEVREKRKLATRDSQQKKAKVLVEQARDLANKLLTNTFQRRTTLVDDISSWAEKIVDFALVDTDAIRCVTALRNKDDYLLEHSVNVSCLLVSFGKHLNMNKAMLKQLAIGGIIHDVGKIRVENKVLNKPGKLTEEEFEQIKMHQTYAKEILAKVDGISQVARDICLMHHEKLDGTGYPDALSADQIPVHSRMSAIVDIYDALTADRCYKKGISSAEAFKIMLDMSPDKLDKELVYKFINCIGIYPVGSVVELSDGRVGVVWERNESNPLEPEVKCVYSRKYRHFIDVSYVKLSKHEVTIERAVAPSALEVDISPYYN
ncbi:HD-GYP domain-containing protein [Vibrio marisflavi]|uniref:Cyclic di-GMP phosphodiesterase n=1 Tax=Vibrio marisflavi CECT 7928 TaxID=634439 RepID=A0ABN8E818_9VIBR|nr:HD-GYP domain-containing protein [Vibrio marisflavi]CAH0539676.1 Cyclic di-GMP phosphodiesterase [Vibrio marisflavi CECT 7928]